MRLASPLLKKVVYAFLAHTGYLRRRAAEGIAVVSVAARGRAFGNWNMKGPVWCFLVLVGE